MYHAKYSIIKSDEERSDSVVEIFTRDRGVAGLSLTGATAICALLTGT